jgi:hypothetical protein
MKYPIGIQNFTELRRDGYVYVDKTALMYKMVSEGKYYFLSRPRRFGKSLFLSTLEAYFEGRRELFKGLAVEQLEHDWRQYPVLHLDLNTENYDTREALEWKLNVFLSALEDVYGKNPPERTVGTRFEGIIKRISNHYDERVVILVDEYDKPMLQSLGNEELQTYYRNMLKAFYGALKSCDRYIKFAFLTGVTKFGKVSIFSDLNNLADLSFDNRYVEVCGISEKELHDNFDKAVSLLAEANRMSKDACYIRLKRDFDGYHFSWNTQGIYNPFSVLSTLSSCQFRDYWFETGTPSFLVSQLKKMGYPLENLTTEEISSSALNRIDALDESPLPLLYQSGYLTLKSYDSEFDTYQLGFPNREVEQGFIKYLLPYYAPKTPDKSRFSIIQFVRDVRNGEADGFMRRLADFFANGDYQVIGDFEKYFQNTLYVFFRLMGFYVEVERHTTDGRMDILMQTPDYIFIIELKVDQTAAEALGQIEEKGYDKPFVNDGRQLFKIGVNFSSRTKQVDGWIVK